MALPERITVKRRRDEDPVDALYIPPNKSRKTFVWNRVLGNSTSVGAQDQGILSAADTPRIPTVRTTLPEEDDLNRLPAKFVSSQILHNDNSSGSGAVLRCRTISTSRSVSNTQDCLLAQLRQAPRKFHFTRAITPTRSSSVLNSGVQKTKQVQGKKLAVFVERTVDREKSKPVRAPAFRDEEYENQILHGSSKSVAKLSRPRRRPLASSVERHWRDQNWKQLPLSAVSERLVVAPEKQMDPAMDSLHLANQLHQFAQSVTQAQNEDRDVRAQTHAKKQSKSPKLRPPSVDADTSTSASQGQKGIMNLLENEEEDLEMFVFDVYVRQAQHVCEKASNEKDYPMLERMNPDNVGVLVISDEDQETWELYGTEDQSTGDEWNSEEEDENAEGYYGNDYPEDELDSDDEHDRYAYKHWQSAFDEEQFGEHIYWSDDELERN